MKAEHKHKWIEALRSGQYKQGRGWLKVKRYGTVDHCCLGVLCEALKDDFSIAEATSTDNPNVYLFNGESDKPAEDLRESLGISLTTMSRLIEFNDCSEWTFDQIADWIEEHVSTDTETETTTQEAGTVRHPNT